MPRSRLVSTSCPLPSRSRARSAAITAVIADWAATCVPTGTEAYAGPSRSTCPSNISMRPLFAATTDS